MGAPVADPGHEVLLAVGSYTESYGAFAARGEGLSLVAMRPDGSLTRKHCLALRSPAYLRHDPSRDLLYVALETGDAAAIATVAIDRNARRFTLRGETGLPGTALCHLDISPDARWIAGACYASGDVSLRRIGEDGIPLQDSGASLRRHGSSIHPRRQTESHPHAARFAPDGRWLVVPDLGTDELACYAVGATGMLGEPPRSAAMPPGSGPRLVLFDAGGRHLLLLHELNCTVSSHAWNDGALSPIMQAAALAAPPQSNTSAGLRWHPSGRHFAVSNCGADTITLFRYDPANGTFAACCEHPAGGAKPRDFAFTPCGRFLLCANQDGDSLVTLHVDAERGTLAQSGHSLAVRTPSCVRVLGIRQSTS